MTAQPEAREVTHLHDPEDGYCHTRREWCGTVEPRTDRETRLPFDLAWDAAHAQRRVENASTALPGDRVIVRHRATLRGAERVLDCPAVDFGLDGDVYGVVLSVGTISRVEANGLALWVDACCLTLVDAGRLPAAEAEGRAWAENARRDRDARDAAERALVAQLRSGWGVK